MECVAGTIQLSSKSLSHREAITYLTHPTSAISPYPSPICNFYLRFQFSIAISLFRKLLIANGCYKLATADRRLLMFSGCVSSSLPCSRGQTPRVDPSCCPLAGAWSLQNPDNSYRIP